MRAPPSSRTRATSSSTRTRCSRTKRGRWSRTGSRSIRPTEFDEGYQFETGGLLVHAQRRHAAAAGALCAGQPACRRHGDGVSAAGEDPDDGRHLHAAGDGRPMPAMPPASALNLYENIKAYKIDVTDDRAAARPLGPVGRVPALRAEAELRMEQDDPGGAQRFARVVFQSVAAPNSLPPETRGLLKATSKELPEN